jgi:hypothetical protein
MAINKQFGHQATPIQNGAAQSCMDDLLLTVDPDSRLLQIGNQLACSACDLGVNQALTSLHKWISQLISVRDLNALNPAPIRAAIPGLHPAFVDAFLATYVWVREGLKVPSAFQKVMRTVQIGEDLLDIVQRYVESAESSFLSYMVQATGKWGTCQLLGDVAGILDNLRDVVYRFPLVPLHRTMTIAHPEYICGRNGNGGGEISICSVLSGGATPGMICDVVVVMMMVILILEPDSVRSCTERLKNTI